ncbi:Rhodanese-like domain-containing protein [Phialemonium atrogriseum]|uniref:Rhodanese-like domain-containing protein n=1 Tax=Phialemonium atrogriseum TaxID=1093897 RepID=A0AAJ0BWJ6_9PEZI|nr:Rhodanese-like domain-containing protein [Phialemonium atrogriseum]KAK1764733.1 Rhodanese-like domain-containing protein [Phialemonium atrogriseum]
MSFPVHANPGLEASEVADLLEKQTSDQPRDFLLVDVRRTDWTGGTIASSINLPAHSLYPTRKIIYDLCKQAGIKRIIFYCGSSNGRGPRSAAWMEDYRSEVGGELQVLIMKGGIRGFVKSYGGRLMDGYDEKAWEGS